MAEQVDSDQSILDSSVSTLPDAGADLARVQQLAGAASPDLFDRKAFEEPAYSNLQGAASPATTARYERREETAKQRTAELMRIPYSDTDWTKCYDARLFIGDRRGDTMKISIRSFIALALLSVCGSASGADCEFLFKRMTSDIESMEIMRADRERAGGKDKLTNYLYFLSLKVLQNSKKEWCEEQCYTTRSGESICKGIDEEQKNLDRLESILRKGGGLP